MADIDTKTQYIMKLKDSSESIIPFYVVQSIGYSFNNSIITYETVGSDGGYSVSTGRTTQEIPVTIQLIGENLQDNLQFIRIIRDEKRAISIFGGINKHKIFGYYLIKSVDTNITDGTDSMIVTITLVEYRDIFINTRNILVPENKSAADVVQYLRSYNQVRE